MLQQYLQFTVYFDNSVADS